MASPYLQKLIHIAKQEVPSLQYDLQNAGTHYALQAAAQKLFEITGYLLHHAIQEAVAQTPLAAPVARQPPSVAPATTPIRPAPAVPTAQASAPIPLDVLDLPPPPAMAQPSPGSAPSMGLPETPPIQPGVANVFVTAQGTRVVAPDGSRALVPPGAPVSSDLTSGQPPTPPEAPDGVANVILPPGGGISPEVAAALAGRSGSAP
jgi:hypothetical protein